MPFTRDAVKISALRFEPLPRRLGRPWPLLRFRQTPHRPERAAPAFLAPADSSTGRHALRPLRRLFRASVHL